MTSSAIPSFSFRLDASSSAASANQGTPPHTATKQPRSTSTQRQLTSARQRGEGDRTSDNTQGRPAQIPARKRGRDPQETFNDAPGFRSTGQTRPTTSSSSSLPDFSADVWRRPSYLPPSPEDSPPLYREPKKQEVLDLASSDEEIEDAQLAESDEDWEKGSWVSRLIEETLEGPKDGVQLQLSVDGFELELEAERVLEEEQAAPLFQQLDEQQLQEDDQEELDELLAAVMKEWSLEPKPDIEVEAAAGEEPAQPQIQHETEAERVQAEKDVLEEQLKPAQEGGNPRYLPPPNVALTPHGSIPVAKEKGTAEAFFPGTPIDDTVRLSSKWLKSLKKPNVVFAAAPSGFHLRLPLPLPAKKARAKTVTSQVVRSTLLSYTAEIIEYIQWCERRKIPANERFPTKEENIIVFLSEFGGLYRASSIMRRLSAIGFWHSAHSLPFSFSQNNRRAVSRSLRNLQPPADPPVPPATVEDLVTVLQSLDNEAKANPKRAKMTYAVGAAMLSLFWGMSRVIELLVEVFEPRNDLTGGFDPKTHPSGTDLSFNEATSKFPRTASIFLPHTKTKSFQGASITLTQQTAVAELLDPIIHLAKHVSENDPQPDEHLFTYTCEDSSRRALTGSWLVKRVNKALDQANRSKLSGRSFRCGGATAYILAGKDAEAVKGLGNWASHAFHLYFRKKREMAACVLANADVPFEELPAEVTEETLEHEIEKLRLELRRQREKEKKEKRRKERKKQAKAKGKKKQVESESESDVDLDVEDEPVELEDLIPAMRTCARREKQEQEQDKQGEAKKQDQQEDEEMQDLLDPNDPEWSPEMEQ